VFRTLRHVQIGDIITLATPAGEKRYRVDWTRTVAPTDVSVLGPTSIPSLTLVTCSPFLFIGHAPKRFVVRAVALPEPAARSIF
jgi:sortase A